MKLEAIKVRLGFIGREESIEASRIVRVEVVEHHPDALRIRVVLLGEFDMRSIHLVVPLRSVISTSIQPVSGSVARWIRCLLLRW